MITLVLLSFFFFSVCLSAVLSFGSAQSVFLEGDGVCGISRSILSKSADMITIIVSSISSVVKLEHRWTQERKEITNEDQFWEIWLLQRWTFKGHIIRETDCIEIRVPTHLVKIPIFCFSGQHFHIVRRTSCMIEKGIWASNSISWGFLEFRGGVTRNGKHYPNSIPSPITLDWTTTKIGFWHVNTNDRLKHCLRYELFGSIGRSEQSIFNVAGEWLIETVLQRDKN